MAEEDEGMEAFDFDERDLEFALNPGRRHYQTKNQATYGIWADRESDEEEAYGRPSFGMSYVIIFRKKARKDYSAPINFISGGIKQGSSLDPSDKVEPFAFVSPHLLFRKRNSSKMGFQLKENVRNADDAPIEIISRKERRKQKSVGANVFAGIRTSAVTGAVDPNAPSDWTKFGKGEVIKNMMKSMGYKEGEGLGAARQGIVEPVQATVRKGRGAIGAYGKEAVGPKFGESAADAQRRISDQKQESNVEELSTPQLKNAWKKAAKVKTRYKTIDEVIEEGGSIGFRSSVKTGVKVIDMTGPEQRVYSGYDSFSMKSRAAFNDISDRDVFDVPELMHNLNLLVDLTEENIRRNDSQLKSIKDRTTALEYDLEQAKLLHETEAKEYERIKEVFELIENFSKRKGDDLPSMNECQQLFVKLRSEYKEEYQLFDIETLAIQLVLPQIVDHFSKWKPLDPEHLIYGVDLMKEWRDILVDKESVSIFSGSILHYFLLCRFNAETHGYSALRSDRLTAYDRLLWEGWLPSLRRASLTWDPRDHMEPMLRVIEMWLPVLPGWMKENILEQVIIPRIEDRVSSWDPLTDSIPIHSWLVPWLAVLGDRLQPVLAPIRQKLAKALRAMAILKPWCGVWTPATMSAFLAQNVVPKLEKCLDTMNLNPRENKKYEEWYSCMSWIGMISADTMASIVTKYFFPRWYSALCQWLDSPRAILDEVKMWYREWDGRIPPQIRDFPTIKENLRRGMVAVMESSQGLRVYNGPPPPPIAQAAPPPPPPSALRPNMGMPISSAHMSLKEMLERIAAQHDLTHIPQRDRLKEGRQVYWFGTQSIYLDRNIVYVLDTHSFSWRPVGMEELLKLAGVG
ncbi:unnamed protein product [Haemonchus placei]|uniref:G-patch domain-containing protein n=1 Tax=Haemonchus placei TaxID=6290 RepID=A0A158QLA9_HAEPC|nr:unnamed protein product [Haemonchus placei]